MAETRKAVSKRTRFEVFKRDRFACQYCGQSPPQVILQIDHIVPVASGGDNSRVNLITACKDCNAGKSSVPLDSVIPSQVQAIEDGEEKLAQLKAFNRFLVAERRERKRAAEPIVEALCDGGWLVDPAELRSIHLFMERLPIREVLEAADVTTAKGKDFRYFCGICWKKIKRQDVE